MARKSGDPVPGWGKVPCKLMLIGERPGKDEDRVGEPFVGLAGVELERFLAAGGLRREQFYITNLVKDYRGGEKPTQEEIDRDSRELWEEIATVDPTIIVLAGAYAIHAFMGSEWHVEDVHGIPFRQPDLGLTFWPMYHPAAGFYDATTQPNILDDCRRLGDFIAGRLAVPIDVYRGRENYKEVGANASTTGRYGAAAYYGTRIAIDTEGSAAQPWCLTESICGGEAAFVQGKENYNAFATYLANRYDRYPQFIVYLHNSLHDLAVLRSLGITLPDGGFIDTMVLAYLLCLEPQGLKNLARRHCGLDMSDYMEIVGPYSKEKALEYLIIANECEWPAAEEYVLGGKIKKPNSVGQRIKRILTDYEKKPDTDLRARWEKIEPWLREPVEEEIGEMPNATLEDVPRPIAIRYACQDADATLRLVPTLEASIANMELEQVAAIDHSIIPMVDRMQYIGMPCDRGRLRLLEAKCDDLMAKAKYRIFQLTGADINPDSPNQVRELLFEQLRLPVERWTKISKEASTDDKALEAIYDLHPVVPVIGDYRGASKVRNSFARAIPRRVGVDGRLHCNLRITRVSSGRLAANSPNLLGIPVRDELGKEVRDCFVTPEGHVFTSHDLDQVEMRFMMNESEDKYGCELFREGKIDIHKQTASLMFAIDPRDVHPMFHRYPAKRVGFGIITQITGYGLAQQMALAHAVKKDSSKWTEDDCDKLIIEWFKIYKQVRPYVDRCRAEARRTQMVRDRWGRIRYLPGAQSPIAKVREEALRQASSHKIQGGAQGIMKRAMAASWGDIKELWAAGYWIEPVLQIHDELMTEQEEDEGLQALWDEMVVERLTKTTILERVPLKAKGGSSREWGKLKD